MVSWKGICTCVGCAVAIGVCVASGGTATPFIAPAVAPYVIGGGAVGGFFLGDKMDQDNQEKEKRLMENESYRDARKAAEDQFKENQKNQNLLLELIGKLNGTIPRETNETDEHLQQQIAIVQNNLKNGEEKYSQLLNNVEKIRRELGGNFSLMSLLGLDKMKMMDKVMIAGGVILIIYLLKS
jgi:hypothetical protein